MTAVSTADATPRNSLRAIRAGTSTFNFALAPKRYGIISLVLVVVCLGGLFLRGLNLGIDFTGGTVWIVEVGEGDPSSGGAREIVEAIYDGEVKAQVLENRTESTRQVRVQAGEVDNAQRAEISEALAKYVGADISRVSTSEVSASWGRQVSTKALQGLVVFLALVALYLTFRLQWKMALSAIAAVLHDLVLTLGVYAWFQFPVTPSTVIAFLTILGFSLYDTVVVFDKVLENQRTLGQSKGDTYAAMVNRSANQVLMRSLNTSFVGVLPVVSLLLVGTVILGATALVEFSLALLVGLLAGVYSSLFVSVPLFAWWKEREPRNRSLRERAVAGRSVVATPTPGSDEHEGDVVRNESPGVGSDAVIRARARKPHRKKK